jgi:murein DD-endopeptidase MepM/ murein hydrolase activator NlpD
LLKFTIKDTKKRYTIMIVPEGTNPILRFKLRLATFLAGSFALAGILITSLVVFTIYKGSFDTIASLKTELSHSSSKLQATVDEKDETIDMLLVELSNLSEKSKSIEEKMIQLELLEAELRSLSIANEEPQNKQDNLRTTLSNDSSDSSQAAPLFSEGVGGEAIALTDDNISSLVHETEESMDQSLSLLPDLQSRLEETKLSIEEYKKMMAILPTFWPTVSERVTSEFGTRRDPFTRKLTLHSGLDIAGPSGDPIYAAANGTITDIAYSNARGNYVTISHPSGLKTNYLHMKIVTATKGAKVQQGEEIGQLGSTGRSTGPHLHFEVIKNGVTVDPAFYLSKSRKEDGR